MYMLPHYDRSCRLYLRFHKVMMYRFKASQSGQKRQVSGMIIMITMMMMVMMMVMMMMMRRRMTMMMMVTMMMVMIGSRVPVFKSFSKAKRTESSHERTSF